MRKTIGLALALALCLSVPVSAAGRFSDVTGWAEPYIEKAAGLGLVTGTGGGNFSPDSSVTYAQFATMLCGIRWKDEVDAERSQNDYGKWWGVYCAVAKRHDIFLNTLMDDELDWDYTANLSVSRTDMAVMAYNFLHSNGGAELGTAELAAAKAEITDIAHLGETQKNAVAYCIATGALSGTGGGKFSSDSTMNRAQAATVLCSVYDAASGTAAPVTPEQPASKPDGAIGGYYDTATYYVPADVNKDGWITEAEVMAVFKQLESEYPDGTPWDTKTRYPGLYEYSGGKYTGGLGASTACDGFARLVSDRIFGNLPKYEVSSIEDIRPGDYFYSMSLNHSWICYAPYVIDDWDGKTYYNSATCSPTSL